MVLIKTHCPYHYALYPHPQSQKVVTPSPHLLFSPLLSQICPFYSFTFVIVLLTVVLLFLFVSLSLCTFTGVLSHCSATTFVSPTLGMHKPSVLLTVLLLLLFISRSLCTTPQLQGCSDLRSSRFERKRHELGTIHYLFTTCSLSIRYLFTVYSHLFTIYLLSIHCTFIIYSVCVR
jgi:hypothetical protein